MVELILAVEDDEQLLRGIRDILHLEGYDVMMALNGVEALTVLKSLTSPPDLILSDIMMPQMNGIEFLQAVRQENWLIAVPFIFLTALSERQEIQRAKELGVDDYLLKPFNPEDLVVAVRSRVDRLRAVREAHNQDQEQLKRKIMDILNHEFRTPLTFVVAYADMLGEIPSSDTPMANQEMLSFLEGVRGGADRLRRLVENFMLLIEIQTGNAERMYHFRRRAIPNIAPLIQEGVQRALKRTGSRRYVIFIEPELPTLVGDVEYLTSAVHQLVDNAFKFCEVSQTVEIGVEKTGFDEICIWVRDYGRGIPPAEQDRIWESFYQVNRSLYEDQGAGSGLAIVKGITLVHGGRVEVTSQINQGSTFKMYLPLQPVKEKT
ncbi:MAG: response regulator [Phototrophicaceae bacterium]